MRVDVLASGFDNLYADRAYYIFKADILTYSMTDKLSDVTKQLEEWQAQGFIKIIKPIDKCAED